MNCENAFVKRHWWLISILEPNACGDRGKDRGEGKGEPGQLCGQEKFEQIEYTDAEYAERDRAHTWTLYATG